MLSQGLLKYPVKNSGKNAEAVKERKDSSLKKKKVGKKSESKATDTSINNIKCFVEIMDGLLEMARGSESIESITMKYAKELMKFNSNNEGERIIFSSLSEHLIFWIEKCQELERSHLEGGGEEGKFREKLSVELEGSSDMSMCSYIVDPKEQVRMKPMREDLKQKLQLNFTKVDYIRKK
jgi:hypothetical protein